MLELEIDTENYNLILLRDYNLILLRDSEDFNKILHAVLLECTENVDDFQDAINNAKEKHEEDIAKYGDDWQFISQELGDFDYIDLDVYDYLDF